MITKEVKMEKLKKGEKLSCVPCGRQIVVDSCGLSTETLWCCGRPMRKKSKASAKKK